jgi:hypothetical protein
MHKLVAVVTLLHFLGTYIAVSLSEPGAGEPPLVPGAEVWKSVLGFPLVTIHDTLFGPFGPGSFGQRFTRWLAVRFWIGGNSFLWAAGIIYGVGGVLRRLRDRRSAAK